MKPVIVFRGNNELEAQMARDTLESAMIPVLHLPSLSTGVFGFRQTTRVAVPSEHAEEAVETLTEAGFHAFIEPRATGVAEFSQTVQGAFPLRSHGWLATIFLVLLLLVLIFWNPL